MNASTNPTVYVVHSSEINVYGVFTEKAEAEALIAHYKTKYAADIEEFTQESFYIDEIVLNERFPEYD